MPKNNNGPALPTVGALRDEGKALRSSAPRRSHDDWEPSARRRDPIDLLVESSRGRLPELLPVRYGRMLASPFAFFRGAAAIMAYDLSATPVTGIQVQACGDCHLMNFGIFASPERRLLFDINDFDETLPAPWEWDVKRLAASFAIASLENGFAKGDARETAIAAARSYRERIWQYAEMSTLESWYSKIEASVVEAKLGRAERPNHADAELERTAGGEWKIVDKPPLIFHITSNRRGALADQVRLSLGEYRESLPPERRVLVGRFQVADAALKVVGIGSVGTRCAIVLMKASPTDTLLLQWKEARTSVLEPYTKKSGYEHMGKRVVVGQRVMQSAIDVFLGWTQGPLGRHYYVRQLRDGKAKIAVDDYRPAQMEQLARFCGWALARAHARSGEAARISGYLGQNEAFDEALGQFALTYARVNESDFAALKRAVRQKRIQAAKV